MPDDFVEKLMSISGHAAKGISSVIDDTLLQVEMASKRKALNESIAMRDKQFIDEESTKIEQWAEDQTFSLEEELRNVKKQIKERERNSEKRLMTIVVVSCNQRSLRFSVASDKNVRSCFHLKMKS